ncbi:MAG: proprotein convertase P-domain-containing protein, partial [Candidatus Hydrogenedentes bacterium]|nr:proprotein convertase P-domain-containing protein [Candidatus Hydrogenedentota bacterium]
MQAGRFTNFSWKRGGLWRPASLGIVALVVALSAGAGAQGFSRDFENCTYYNSVDVPKVIADDQVTTTISELTITESFMAGDINVRIDIDHIWLDDLDIFLESPTGTLVELTTDIGDSNDDYTATVFDEQATAGIAEGTAPYTGCFRPEGSLAVLEGEAAQGTWKLHVFDDFQLATGTIQGWQLQFDCYCGEVQENEYPSGDVPQSIPDDQVNAAVS